MSARLPTPGSDSGDWGDILNAYLEVSLNSDGTLNSSALTQAGALTQTSADSRYVQSTLMGTPSGVATLDGGSHLKASQLPSSVVSDSSVAPKAIDSTGVLNGQSLVYNGSTSKWQPGSSAAKRWCQVTFPPITLNTGNSWLWTPGATDMSIFTQFGSDFSVVSDGFGSQNLVTAGGGVFQAAARMIGVMTTLDSGSSLTRIMEFSFSFQVGPAGSNGLNQNGTDAVMPLGTDGRTSMWLSSPGIISPGGNLFNVAGDLFAYMANGHLTDVSTLTLDIYLWTL